jgi:hypothetical protein
MAGYFPAFEWALPSVLAMAAIARLWRGIYMFYGSSACITCADSYLKCSNLGRHEKTRLHCCKAGF